MYKRQLYNTGLYEKHHLILFEFAAVTVNKTNSIANNCTLLYSVLAAVLGSQLSVNFFDTRETDMSVSFNYSPGVEGSSKIPRN